MKMNRLLLLCILTVVFSSCCLHYQSEKNKLYVDKKLISTWTIDSVSFGKLLNGQKTFQIAFTNNGYIQYDFESNVVSQGPCWTSFDVKNNVNVLHLGNLDIITSYTYILKHDSLCLKSYDHIIYNQLKIYNNTLSILFTR